MQILPAQPRALRHVGSPKNITSGEFEIKIAQNQQGSDGRGVHDLEAPDPSRVSTADLGPTGDGGPTGGCKRPRVQRRRSSDSDTEIDMEELAQAIAKDAAASPTRSGTGTDLWPERVGPSPTAGQQLVDAVAVLDILGGGVGTGGVGCTGGGGRRRFA